MMWTLCGRFWHLLSKPVSDFPSEEGEGFSSEMLAGIRHGKFIYLDMNYEEEFKYTAQYGIGFQLYTAVKMENSKKSSTTRVTANPQRVPKWIISDWKVKFELSRGAIRAWPKQNHLNSMFSCFYVDEIFTTGTVYTAFFILGDTWDWDSIWIPVADYVSGLCRVVRRTTRTRNANSTFFRSQNRARTIRRDALAIDEQAYPDFYKKAYLSIWQHPILTSTRKRIGIMAFWENSLWVQASGSWLQTGLWASTYWHVTYNVT